MTAPVPSLDRPFTSAHPAQHDKSLLFKAAFAVLGILALVALWWPGREKIGKGYNDFVMFYAGTHLVGSRDLYQHDRMIAVEYQTSGAAGESLQYTRPPYYAVLCWPLGRLPFRWAYAVWQSLALLAVLAFILLWPGQRWTAILACCWSVPLSAAFAEGQDTAFLLVWITLVLRFHKTRPFLAGLLLSLCAAKFQLFLLLPLLILLQRRWSLAAGLLTGGGALLVICFLAGGPTWPLDYYRLLTTHKIPGGAIMPNLHGLVLNLPRPGLLEAVLALAVAAAAAVVARFAPFEPALAAILIGGLLVSNHAYPADAVVLLPALLLLMTHWASPFAARLSALLLVPIPYVMLMISRPLGHPLRLGLMLLLGALAWQAAPKLYYYAVDFFAGRNDFQAAVRFSRARQTAQGSACSRR